MILERKFIIMLGYVRSGAGLIIIFELDLVCNYTAKVKIDPIDRTSILHPRVVSHLNQGDVLSNKARYQHCALVRS